MAQGKFIAYYRVSTVRQGVSGLGLEAQRASVATYLNGGSWELVGEYTEVETGGKAKLDNRPKLRAALAQCKQAKAVLVIAKLDRLARNVHFVSGLIESGVEFVAADMPHANKVMIQMHAVMSEWERDQISKRTKDALAAAKARGVKLGTAGPANLGKVNSGRKEAADAYAHKMSGTFLRMRAAGMSQRKMVAELNSLGLPSPRGGQWHLPSLQLVLARVESEQRVRDQVVELKREGVTVQTIAAELKRRAV